MGKKWKKPIAILLAATMVITPFSSSAAKAAKKTITLVKAKQSLKVGKQQQIKINNTTGKKIKSVKWSVTKGKNAIKLSKKSKSSVTVKAVKKGNATVQAKVKMTDKTTYTKKVNLIVSAASKPSVTPSPDQEPTAAPEATVSPDVTASPDTSASPDTTANPQSATLLHYNMTCSEDGKRLLDQSGNGNDAELSGVSSTLQQNHSLLIEKNGYIKLPEKVFAGRDTFTVSVWLKNYSGTINTSAMFVGTKENMPISYWLLNPSNPEGRMKSVMTNSKNAAEPYTTEVGISASIATQGTPGPFTGTEWNHYVTVITPDSITGYFNGKKVGTSKLNMKFSDFGNDLAAYIGKSSYPDVTWTGFVREVEVFQNAKTDAEVAQIYESTKEADMDSKGTKSEIFIADRADPYITLGADGYYYFTASYPMRGAGDKDGYDRIILRRSKTLEGLKTAEEKAVWDESESKISHRFIWAPEMHYIGGKWYLYYAASGSPNNVWDINCHVLMCEGNDPYNDKWVEKGKFQAAKGDNLSFTGFSLDMTYFECNGKSYVIWAQKPANSTSNLYMAEVDPAEPWKTTTKAMLLTKPEYYWECVSIPVNEGPSVLIHNGKVIVAYSAAATGPEYCIGYMYADEKADLMDIKSWTKQKTPALTSEDLVEEYGPGHNSFTKDENGNDIFVYHSRSKECYEGTCGYGTEDPLYDPCRSARIRTVQWDENGLPILNR
ncbi:MAG: family 43 glycosylhydrolase [Lachnospiraceae bacterium]|nr:family 43 glycosylhydrolase [Lachnospiraceae bacterium]